MPAAVGLFGGPENGGESLVWSGLEQGKEPGSNILWGVTLPCHPSAGLPELSTQVGWPDLIDFLLLGPGLAAGCIRVIGNCLRATLVLGLAVLLRATAQSRPGFDCAKAITTLDRLICSAKDFATLDPRLIGRYAPLRDHASRQGLAVLRDSQRKLPAVRKA